MKNILHIILGSLIMFSLYSCKQDTFDYANTGVLSFSDFSLNSSASVNEDYIIRIHGFSSEKINYESTYREIKSLNDSEITLNAGEYILEARSSESVPDASFETSLYGCSVPISIEYGKTTQLGELTCTLLQCAISIDYNEEFLKSVTGNGVASVEILSGQSLNYPLTLSDDGTISFEKRTGYFSMGDAKSSSIIVTYRGYIDGHRLKMTTTMDEVKVGEHYTITLIKKNSVNDDPRFLFGIEDLISDDILDNSQTE